MQIKTVKEYTQIGIEKRLLAYDLASAQIEKMLRLARENRGKVIIREVYDVGAPIIGLKYEREGGKMRWFLLE